MGHQSFTVRILGDFPHLLSALQSNNQFRIKLAKMWPGGTGRNFEDKLNYTPSGKKKNKVMNDTNEC